MEVQRFGASNGFGGFNCEQYHVWVDEEEVAQLFSLKKMRSDVFVPETIEFGRPLVAEGKLVLKFVSTLSLVPSRNFTGCSAIVKINEGRDYLLEVGIRGLKEAQDLGVVLKYTGRIPIVGSNDFITIMPDYWLKLPDMADKCGTEETKN